MKPKHVIFRSRGCRTCRARKVKCDEARPVCQRCVRSRFQCQGYTEPTIFLSDNPQGWPSSSTALSKSAVRSLQAHHRSAVPQALLYPAELTYIGFLVNRLCIGTPGDRRGFSWLKSGLEASDPNNLFHKSSRCLAEVFYGRVSGQEAVITSGMAKYGSILQLLRQQLQIPTSFRGSNLMSVIMIAVIIESVADQSARPAAAGLRAHLRGLAQIVERAGPEAFQGRPNVLMFELYRCFLIGRATMAKQETFVANMEWKTIPWMYERKNIFVQLWDILCDLPSLMFNLQRLQDAPSSGLEPAISVEAMRHPRLQAITVLQNLLNWRWDWERQYYGNAYEGPVIASSSLITDRSGNPQYSTMIHYSNRWRAMEIMYYDATLIFLLRLGKRLRWDLLLQSSNTAVPHGFAQPLPPSPLLLPPDIRSLEDASSEFYRSVEGCLSVTDKDAGEWYQLMWTLSLVNAGLEEDSVEVTWMRRIRSRIVAISGLDLWSASRRSF